MPRHYSKAARRQCPRRASCWHPHLRDDERVLDAGADHFGLADLDDSIDLVVVDYYGLVIVAVTQYSCA
jgi:hypothetical protein